MRKMACALLVLLMLSGCGKAQEPENPYRLKKTTIEHYYRDRENFTWEFENTYDENGWLIENQEYENGVADTKIIYEHDEFGNIIRTTQIHTDGTRNVSEDKLTLDDQHRIIYSESTWNGKPQANTEYGYNDEGLVTKLYINRIGALNGKDMKSFVDSTYDSKGNLIRQDIRWEPSNTMEYTLYTYENDKILRTETYANEELNYYTEYTYDDTGLIQTSIEHSADGTLQSKRVTTSDEYGNQLEVISYFYASDRVRYGTNDEEPDSRTTYVYELKEEN